MKLTIRFADQIVGALIILALGILIFVIFMLGTSQRWFSRDYHFYSYFSSASGLSQNMGVQYKGFTIGHVKSIKLVDDDRVEVRFSIFDTYIDRVKNGSLVEVLASPIGGLGGNQFLFHPGLGSDLLSEGDTIPSVNSSEGKRLVAIGLAARPERDDGINNIMISTGSLLTKLNELVADLQEAFEGSDRTSLGRTLGGFESTMTGLQELPGGIEDALDAILRQVDPILANLQVLSDGLVEPDGTIMAILDSEGDVYGRLTSSLDGLSGTLRNLEKMTDPVSAQLTGIFADLQTALTSIQDILVSIANNPLLKRGIPERAETKVGGAHARDADF
ncbi:MAG: MlaD family protein [Treponema sp.]|nr:MlaD family protein [Treponema sp.]